MKISNFKLRQGFTMIELLIVIAVLGVLAVAVLSAINPIEQINRGRDTGSRSDAEQLLSAIDRYYAAQEIYPWQTKADTDLDTTRPVGWEDVDEDWPDSESVSVLEKMSAEGTGEIKKSFVTRISNLTEEYKLKAWHNGASDDSTYICFSARSASFQKEALDRCGSDDDGLPEDLGDQATVICNDDAPYICLP